jgi:hypothetical protein
MTIQVPPELGQPLVKQLNNMKITAVSQMAIDAEINRLGEPLVL